MGRRGGGGGGRSSGGGSRSRSSGGRSVGGGGRRSSSSFSVSSRSRSSHYGGHHHHHHYHSSPGRYRAYGGGGAASFITMIFIIGLLVIASTIFGGVRNQAPLTNTTPRTKITPNHAFNADCIDDDLFWLENTTMVKEAMRVFYNDTGVQPYLVLAPYRSDLSSDDARLSYAESYFDNYIGDEGSFLLMYIDGDDEDGWYYWVNGYQVDSVMDTEACEILLNYIDRYWFSDATEDEIYAYSFEETAETIMHVSTTTKDIIFISIICGVIFAVVVVGAVVLVAVSKNKRAKAEADAQILNAPLEKMGTDKADDLTNKYL